MEMAKTKLLIVTHEMSPFLELTKISEITRQLPQANLLTVGNEVAQLNRKTHPYPNAQLFLNF